MSNPSTSQAMEKAIEIVKDAWKDCELVGYADSTILEGKPILLYNGKEPGRILVPLIATALDSFVSEQTTKIEVDCVKHHANAERLIAWITEPARKPANTAFTAGTERQVAYAVEQMLSEQRNAT